MIRNYILKIFLLKIKIIMILILRAGLVGLVLGLLPNGHQLESPDSTIHIYKKKHIKTFNSIV